MAIPCHTIRRRFSRSSIPNFPLNPFPQFFLYSMILRSVGEGGDPFSHQISRGTDAIFLMLGVLRLGWHGMDQIVCNAKAVNFFCI